MKMCKFFNISRSGSYDWSKREHDNGKDLMMRDLIGECHLKISKDMVIGESLSGSGANAGY